ncbi:MAG: peptidoglycan DD-metalloendopeptidase family protein [Candidatus Paceibacterota bacterium]
MKPYQDYKKQYRKFLILFLGFLIIFPFVFSSAKTVNELNDKINQKNTDIGKLEEEIKQYQLELNDLSKQKNSLNVSIKQLDLTKKKLNADISVTQNKIDKTNLKIQELSLNINDKQNIIYNNIDVISSDLRIINQFEQNDALLVMLSENNFTNVWNDIDNIVAVNDAIIKSTTELKQVKIVLEDTRTETTKAKDELLSLKSKLSDQKKIVDENTREKNKLLIKTKNNETNYQKLLKDGLAKKDAFEKELRDYESQLQYVLDPSKLPNGGVLSWPLDYVLITQSFGKTEAGKRLYASGTHNGVDFRAPIGTPVKALADGVVAGVGDTDIQCSGVSFGRFVLIKYNNGLASTFGHLSLIKVNTGDKVSRGEIVGYSGNTGYSTGPHLHLSIYAKDAVNLKTLPSKSCPGRVLTQPISPINAYLDPLYYLPSTTASMFK